jgi:hypothetical protein
MRETVGGHRYIDRRLPNDNMVVGKEKCVARGRRCAEAKEF